MSQKWFLADNSEEEKDAEKTWKIPLLLATKAGYDTEVTMMSEKEQTVPLPPGTTWVKLNAGQFMPHRVLYDVDSLNALSAAVAASGASSESTERVPGVMCAEDRIGLLLDTNELCKSGHYENSCANTLRLLKGFGSESNSNVWCALKMVIDNLEKLLTETDVIEYYQKFVAEIVKGPVKQMGWDHDAENSDLTKQQRGLMIGFASTYLADDEEIRSEALRRFDAFVEDQNTDLLPDDYKASVFKIVLKGDAERAAKAY